MRGTFIGEKCVGRILPGVSGGGISCTLDLE